MRTNIYSVILAIAVFVSAYQPVMAQAQKGVKKDKWVEAVYPGGGWLLPWKENVVQIRLHINRYDIPTNVPDHFYGWGDIELSDVDWDVEGQLETPKQVGNVYYFGITSEKGSGTIGLQKIRDNPENDPYLKIVEVSGVFAKWIKSGSKLTISQGNGRLYDPTVHAMTETELDGILKNCNDDNFIDYSWWVKNRNYSNASSRPTAVKSSGQLCLMGIPVKQPKANIEAQLKSKGFRQGKDYDGNDCLSGKADGMSVNAVVADKCLTVTDKKAYSYTNAKKRFSALVTKMTTEYGKGKYTSDGEDVKSYEIGCPGGMVEISMYDSDVVNYNSGQYLVSVTYNATYATEKTSTGTATNSGVPKTTVKTVRLQDLLRVSGQGSQRK